MDALVQKKLGIAITLLVVLLLGFFLVNHFASTEKQGNPTPSRPYRGTLEGEYVCLPYKEGMELVGGRCAFGLKTDVDEYYAIDFALMSATLPQFSVGERIKANGKVTPVAFLDERQWSEYPIVGSFSVTDSVEVLQK